MIRILLFLLCFQSAFCDMFDEEFDFDPSEQMHPLFVSLGSSCRPALNIRNQDLRKEAYPFDWYLSYNGDKIIEILDEDFAHYFDVASLGIYPNNSVLLNYYYQLEFSHEGIWTNENFVEKYREFCSKYSRRIERFRKLREYKGPIYFVRGFDVLSTHVNYAFHHEPNLFIQPEYSQRLLQALERYFPNVNLHLVILNPDVSFSVEGKIIEWNFEECKYEEIHNAISP